VREELFSRTYVEVSTITRQCAPRMVLEIWPILSHVSHMSVQPQSGVAAGPTSDQWTASMPASFSTQAQLGGIVLGRGLLRRKHFRE